MAAFAEGMPCWLDASLPDLEAGKRFYGELFGWTFGPGGGPEYAYYTEAFSGGKRVAGLVAKRDGRMPTTWGIYFATADAAALGRRIEAAGGRLVNRPLPQPMPRPLASGPSGALALAADPGGAVFGLWEAGDDTGFEKQGTPGAFCWTEVYTRDPARVDPFYASVLGFQGTDLPDSPEGGGVAGAGAGEEVPFRMWSPAGTEAGPDTAIGGRSVITDAFPKEMPAHFLNYFSVGDCDAAATDVVRLGGRITAAPFDIPSGRMAVLTDNQGASFAVLAEAPGDPEKGPQEQRVSEARGEETEEAGERATGEATGGGSGAGSAGSGGAADRGSGGAESGGATARE
jgi:predicted enzyme related to lactoylglutathione lyase